MRLIASARVLGGLAEVAAYGGGQGLGAGLAHAAHRHAQMLGLHDDDHPAGFEDPHQGVGDLGGHPLLDLRAPGVDVDEPGQLGQPGDLPLEVGGVADVGHAVEGHQVVLAEAVDLDVLDDHHLVVIGVEHRVEDVLGTLPEARELFGVRPRDARGGVDQTIAVGVLPDRDEDLTDRLLDPRVIDRRSVQLR